MQPLLRVAAMVLLALSGCKQPPASPPISTEGRQICRERAAAAATTSAAQKAFALCLQTVEAELLAIRRQNIAQQAEQAKQERLQPPETSPTERYSHCFKVRELVIEAERDRILKQGRWIVVASRHGQAEDAYIEAKRAYDRSVAELERLIPPDMRMGEPLIPDAVDRFRVCDRKAFLGSS